jgi:hypothetical protein
MKKATLDPLVGKFFHSRNGDKIDWQGNILNRIPGTNHYLLQLFSWEDGLPTDQYSVELKEDRR